MGAQLTLYPVEEDVGVDSPRSLAGDFQTTNRDSVFWMPAFGMAEITLANSSPSSIFVKLRCGSINEDFVVPAMAAAVREVHASHTVKVTLSTLSPAISHQMVPSVRSGQLEL
jgi:hypothetical protein